MTRAIATLQPLWQLLVLLGVASVLLDSFGLVDVPDARWWALSVAAVLVACGLMMNIGPKTDSARTCEVSAPVRGDWVAINSPGQKIPSHGTRALGQRSAVDLVQPDDETSGRRNAPLMRWAVRGSAPEEFRCFGAPITSMAEGVVVAVSAVQRDQRARNTWQMMAWFFTGENFLRVLAGWRAVVGNRIVIKHDDGLYAAYVHLKRGSAEVSVGERVQQGQVIAAVGNTGNTTQPHLHVQLMDRARFPAAAGIPMSWPDITVGGIDPGWQTIAAAPAASAIDAMPRNGQVFSA